MKQMHQVPTRTLKTSFKITRMTDVFGLPEKMHPLPRRGPHHRFRVVLRRAIVNDLDLHDVWAGILRQHTLQRLAQKPSAMKCGYHYRPEWPMRVFLEDGLNERAVCKRVCE